jgi:hypothetical protein
MKIKGMMEVWNNGMMGKNSGSFSFNAVFQYSTIPLFQF